MKASEIIELLGREYVSLILHSLYWKKETTIEEFATQYKVPSAVAYRQFIRLEKAGFLKVTGKKLVKGQKRARVFVPLVKSIEIPYTEEKLKIIIKLIDGRKLVFED